MFIKNEQYEILTPTGFKNFKGILTKEVEVMYHLTFNDDTILKCSGGHALLTPEGFVQVRYLKINDSVSGKKIKHIFKETGRFTVFDPVEVDDHNTYISNGVISHNTAFLGSSDTLISSAKIQQLMTAMEPNPIILGSMKYYELPIPDHTYTTIVDVSEGIGADYSVFSIIDVTKIPYKVVATFRDNKIKPLLLPALIVTESRKYNEAHVLVEINSIGLQVADILHYDFAYENLIKIQSKGKQGQQWTPGFTKKIAYGLKTSTQTKQIGCSNLKALIESDKLIVTDEITIKEFTTFVSEKRSYKAEDGSNDDMVMTLVNFSWLMAQKFFKETMNSDARKSMQEEQLEMLDRDLVPFGIINGYQGTDDDDHDGFDTEGEMWVREREKYFPFDNYSIQWQTRL